MQTFKTKQLRCPNILSLVIEFSVVPDFPFFLAPKLKTPTDISRCSRPLAWDDPCPVKASQQESPMPVACQMRSLLCATSQAPRELLGRTVPCHRPVEQLSNPVLALLVNYSRCTLPTKHQKTGWDFTWWEHSRRQAHGSSPIDGLDVSQDDHLQSAQPTLSKCYPPPSFSPLRFWIWDGLYLMSQRLLQWKLSKQDVQTSYSSVTF